MQNSNSVEPLTEQEILGQLQNTDSTNSVAIDEIPNMELPEYNLDEEANILDGLENASGTELEVLSAAELPETDAATEASILAEIGGGGNVREVNHDACGIWLCLPVGFAHPECSGPRREMIRRLWRGKGPVPSWGSCTADAENPDQFEVTTTRAAFIPPSTLVPNHTGCNIRDGEQERPRGCVETVKRYQLMQNGQPFGAAYYNFNAIGGVMLDEREHCDVAEEEQHPSCFNAAIAEAGSEVALSVDPNTIFDRSCPGRAVEYRPSWCFDHSGPYCDLAENTGSAYCRQYFRDLENRENER